MHITIDHVGKWFGQAEALADVTLDIVPGQIVAILGPNGAGKTTLLRALAGIAYVEPGEIRYDGERFLRDRLHLRKRLGFLPDFPFVYDDMTVIRHIGMVLRLYEKDHAGVEETVIELLRDFDLLPLAEMRLGTLSRGERYKAALTALLAADPELLLFDEPFASGMDPRGLTGFKRRARAATERGSTVIYSTQILDVAASFSDRVCILHRGRVHAFDSVANLQAQRATQEGAVLEAIFEQLHEAAT
jgi:ABC-2 type transport system ATP-binding protein